jgi:hypothetical protein
MDKKIIKYQAQLGIDGFVDSVPTVFVDNKIETEKGSQDFSLAIFG